MFCPNCRTEYRVGFTVCADCGAALVPELPPEPPKASKDSEPTSSLVTIFESYNLPAFALAKSIIEDAGIEYISNDLAESYPPAGPMIIQVRPDDTDQAHALLADLELGLLTKEERGLEEEGDRDDQEQQ